MILAEIKDYLQKNRIVSLETLVAHFAADENTIRDMLKVWIKKGKVRKVQKTDLLCQKCEKCYPSSQEIYEWLENEETFLTTSLKGETLLNNPRLNKGTAFTTDERTELALTGLLPPVVETIEQQAVRVWQQLNTLANIEQKNIYLMELFNTNETLFYRLVKEHVERLLPIIYTPTVGTAVKKFSDEWRQLSQGLYLTYDDIDSLESIFDRYTHANIDVIVVTDGEGVLGIGDQGVGAIYISVAKLMLYSLFAGVNPANTLPIVLDLGTNNQQLLANPQYLGKKNPRLEGKQYDHFIAAFVAAVKKKFPSVFLHWEDFGRENAYKNLHLYRNKISSFNDDIQGTGVVTLAAIMAGIQATNNALAEQRIVIFGAGTAGTGIADQIRTVMEKQGVNNPAGKFWLLDKQGLLTTNTSDFTEAQKIYLRDVKEIIDWRVNNQNNITLLEVVKNVKPTILIGCSGVGGAFSEEVIRAMAQNIERPLILPLSNPTEKAEAIPQDLLSWTDGKALIATGSPFGKATYKNKEIVITQCNNALSFPGIGLGVIATKATKLTDEMLWQACMALYQNAPILHDNEAPLLPSITEAAKTAWQIALAVAKQAVKEGVATKTENIEQLLTKLFWEPKYLSYRLK